MAQYEVKKGWTYVAPNGVISTPGQIVDIDESKITPGENLQKPTDKALAAQQAAEAEKSDDPPFDGTQT